MLAGLSNRLNKCFYFSALFILSCFLYADFAHAKICFVLDQDCIDGVYAGKDSEGSCTGYNSTKDYSKEDNSIDCSDTCTSHGTKYYKCKCKNDNLKCIDTACSACKYINDDTCPAEKYRYSSDKEKDTKGQNNGTGWDCEPCIDHNSAQYGKYDCKCDDSKGYWEVNGNCAIDPCYFAFLANESERVPLSDADGYENLEYTCERCTLDKQSKYKGKAVCKCEGIIDPARSNRCIPQGRCDADGYYYTKAACTKVWGLSGICKEITSGPYKWCYQGLEDVDDICPSPYYKNETDCNKPFVPMHPSITTPHSHQPCYGCRDYECKMYEDYDYFKEDCEEADEALEMPISASNVTSVSGGKKVVTEDLECVCASEGPGSGTEKELNGMIYTYYDMSPCCKWLKKVDNDVKQIFDDISSLKDKSFSCKENAQQCWYNTFTSRGCTARYETEMKNKGYKWTEDEKNSKEYNRTHFCYYPEMGLCEIMNKCDLFKCDTAYFKIQASNFACVTNAKFGNNTQLSDPLIIGQPAQIAHSGTSSCGGTSYPNYEYKGWVLGETPPDISTGAKMANYMRNYTPERWQSSSSISLTAELLRQFEVQTTGDCAGNINYGVLQVFPYVKINCPTGSKFNQTSTSLNPDNYKCGTSGSKGYDLIDYNNSVYSDACKMCTKVYKCTTGYSATEGHSELGTDGYYYGDTPCYRICPVNYIKNQTASNCGTTGAAGWYVEKHNTYTSCYTCKALSCPTGYSTSYTSYGRSATYNGNNPCYRICPTAYEYDKELSSCSSGTDTSGWELEYWSYNNHCRKCKSKTCPPGYSTTVTSYGTNGKAGDSTCYRICHTDYEYGLSYSGCGSTGSSGWTLLYWTNNNCRKCLARSCPIGYSTTYTSYGTSSTYNGQNPCYRICHTDYTYNKSASSCGSRGAKGWTIETWSSNSNCGKCKAKSCPDGYTTSYTSYGSSTTDYAGDYTCYRVCPSGYSKTETCSTGYKKEYHSTATSCYKCVEECNSSHSDWCPVHNTCHVNCCKDGTIKPCDTRCGGSGCDECPPGYSASVSCDTGYEKVSHDSSSGCYKCVKKPTDQCDGYWLWHTESEKWTCAECINLNSSCVIDGDTPGWCCKYECVQHATSCD